MERQLAEALQIKELVAFERKGSFITLKFPSRNISLAILDSLTGEASLRDSDDVPENFFEEDLKRINLSENGAGPYLLVSTEIETATLENPFKMSKDSQAKYLIKSEIDGTLLLFQYLKGQTSRHSHNGFELFIPFDEKRPSFAKNSSVFSVTKPLWIEPDTIHEAFSLDEPTLTVIVQPANVNHFTDPVGRSNLEQMREEARLLV